MGTALVAASLDLLLDCYGLDRGLWEWSNGGPYAAEIRGPNGKPGIPIANFVGWIALTGGVTSAYLTLAGDPSNPPSVSRHTARSAAFLLLPYDVVPAIWAIRYGKSRYLLYSAIVPLALVLSLSNRH